MLRNAIVLGVLLGATAAASPLTAATFGPSAPNARAISASIPARAIDPQAGEAWGGDLASKLDAASGRTWRNRFATVMVGYQQRDFAPSPPDFDRRGYEHMLKDAPDMAGFSFNLRTR